MSSTKTIKEEIARNRAAAFGLVYVQLIVTVVMVFPAYIFGGLEVTYSALLGSSVYVLPNIYFIRCAFRKAESQTPQLMMNWFYFGEILKILLTIGLFAMCFALVKPLHVPAVFIAYIVMMVVNLTGMSMIKIQTVETQINDRR